MTIPCVGAPRAFSVIFAVLSLTLTGLASSSTLSLSGQAAATAEVGKTYSFRPQLSGTSKRVSFRIENMPAWAAFDSSTGALSGVPGSASIGHYGNIVISAKSGGSYATLPAFSISVISPNTAPRISGAPTVSTFVGRNYSFTPTATDADGNNLTFSVLNKPTWASFNSATGTLSGTPTTVGSFANIVISVSDGKASASLAPFTLEVLKAVTGSARLFWESPTLDVGGEPLTGLAGFRVYYGTDPQNLNQKLELPAPNLTSVEIQELPSGTHYFAVQAYTAAGLASELSSVVWKTIM